MINIGKFKKEFTTQFPDSALTAVLIQEKDHFSAEELLAKVGTWLAILNANKKR
jgi:pheromone shutdown protein TraB